MVLVAQTPLPTLLCLLGLAIVVCFVLLRTQRTPSRNPQEGSPHTPPPRPEREKPSYRDEAPNDVLRWEVSMHETARDLSAQLDSKLGTLQHLIHEADRAAARLEAALQATGGPPGGCAAADAAAQRDSIPQVRPVSQAEALRAGRTGDEPKTTVRGPSGGQSAGDSRYQEIYTLSDYGYPASEIAQRLGSPIGEIELILSLRHKR